MIEELIVEKSVQFYQAETVKFSLAVTGGSMEQKLIVKLILKSEIILYGNLEQYSSLRFAVVRKARNTFSFKFTPANNDAFLDINLIETLIYLREDLGCVFQEDHKQIYSPAEFMRELLSRGYKLGEFKTINGENQVREFG
ncbi:hypothetical protein [Pontibacillus sp. HMF3514]|uniref:hypothetical protein n=1 Tax=Pontibacillus sp. HMF3514 TaxID=2692425 RepID=UPI00132012FC|nr:hypothetical protein [Pontibacillus sp. HMF3514]QHE52816.1 hypothetical protein GS400_12625 [Pontibacillus sp. HMF3514]